MGIRRDAIEGTLFGSMAGGLTGAVSGSLTATFAVATSVAAVSMLARAGARFEKKYGDIEGFLWEANPRAMNAIEERRQKQEARGGYFW